MSQITSTNTWEDLRRIAQKNIKLANDVCGRDVIVISSSLNDCLRFFWWCQIMGISVHYTVDTRSPPNSNQSISCCWRKFQSTSAERVFRTAFETSARNCEFRRRDTLNELPRCLINSWIMQKCEWIVPGAFFRQTKAWVIILIVSAACTTLSLNILCSSTLCCLRSAFAFCI